MIERLKNIVHRDRYDHRPSLEELKNPPVIGGEYPEGEGQEIELFIHSELCYPTEPKETHKIPWTPNTLDPNRVPADYMPWAHTRERLDSWQESAKKYNTKLQTQMDEGEEMC